MTVPITAKLSGVTDWGTSGLVDAVLSALGGAFVDAATAISTAAVAALTATTTVDLSAAWFRRNVAVTDALLDSPRSVVLREAYNRMPAQMAVLHRLLAR